MDSMSSYSQVLAQRQAEETALAVVCHRADREARRLTEDCHWPLSVDDGWLMRKVGKPILDYLFYLAR